MSTDYRANAENLLENAQRYIAKSTSKTHAADLSAAVGHGFAVLAAASANSVDSSAYRAALASYRRIIVDHIAATLSDAKSDPEHHRAITLAQALDEAGLNVDDAVNDVLKDGGWRDVQTPWESPSARRARIADIKPPF